MQVRPAEPEDHAAIDALLKTAFEGNIEAMITTALRAADADTLELVAERDGEIIGEIMFSPAVANYEDGRQVFGLALGPVAVRPPDQRRGIGSVLIEEGLDHVKTYGVPFCMLLGHKEYYPRFGFEPAANHGWRWGADPEGKTGDAFQLMVFDRSAVPDAAATAAFHAAFDIDS